MGAMQRRKGANWERAVVRWFRDAGHNAQRMAPLQAGSGSCQPDVMIYLKPEPVLDSAGLLVQPEHKRLAVECKAGARIQWMKALTQAQENSPDSAIPAVVAKIDRCEPVIMMTLADFNSLVRT